jgi:FAD/FMN-containing dehydrogenase
VYKRQDVTDVIIAVNFAREQNLPLAVRSGGHSFPGFSSTEGGIVIDLTAMKQMTIDPVRRVARVQPGLTWEEYAKVAAVHGLATTSGDVPTVGIGGLTLGGGIGWMVRKYGLTIDHLLSVELVTADGRLIRASADEHADLFWALRGGGGNFGVVTSFEFRLEPAPMILGGALIYDGADAERILRETARIAEEAADELTVIVFYVHAPPVPFLPESVYGKPVVLIGLCYAGDPAEGEQAIAPLRALGTPLADLVQPMPYPGMFELTREPAAWGFRHGLRSGFFQTLDDEAIATLVRRMNEKTGGPALVQLRILGGAMARVPAEATAFAHRDKRYMVTVEGSSETRDSDEDRAWMEETWRLIQPQASGVYVNFLEEEGQARTREAYVPSTFERLAAIKAQYDPANLFKRNQNIAPRA